jgi:hypothetical protein
LENQQEINSEGDSHEEKVTIGSTTPRLTGHRTKSRNVEPTSRPAGLPRSQRLSLLEGSQSEITGRRPRTRQSGHPDEITKAANTRIRDQTQYHEEG